MKFLTSNDFGGRLSAKPESLTVGYLRTRTRMHRITAYRRERASVKTLGGPQVYKYPLVLCLLGLQVFFIGLILEHQSTQKKLKERCLKVVHLTPFSNVFTNIFYTAYIFPLMNYSGSKTTCKNHILRVSILRQKVVALAIISPH